MNKENNINQKKYCMCNVLFKGLEKTKYIDCMKVSTIYLI